MEHRREEIARVTNGYSPAMLEQVTSMALTIAHHSQRDALDWDDLVEAMTTLEAGTAVGIEYIPEESRAVAIHEAGHAAAGHAYLKGAESTRLSIRMRGGALGHHQALEKEERFSRFRSEEFARLVWGLGAMAAERVFYGENSNGVGGDVQSVTAQAAYMVGASAMGPQPFEISPERTRPRRRPASGLKRFEKIGTQIIARTGGGGPFGENPVASVLGDRDKRAIARQILGQAYVAAHNLDPREPRGGRADRRRAVREARALRRRAPRSARGRQADDSRGRSLRGEFVADDVMRRAAETTQTAPVGRPFPPVESPAPTARAVSSTAAASRRSTSCSRQSRGGIGALVVLLDRGAPAPEPAWSRWEPPGSPERRAAQIGDQVSDAYRLPSGNPLAA